ncbi:MULTISPECIES: triose-phosphate isomerase [Pseudanabaena]|uniref:Triosephosphate isomerase n=2 Tax=Pseudanabaena TaxID=1152 RepID=A0A9X4MAJ3_9CYAN|nr:MULTISPECIES: triose-phosphate isomerase [Pseudanabaena]MDG3495655.1 triose-phosphate isomerase [Pseudanabaena catenata USMAC16]TYQ31776.1 triose-phosphate isomerase [Pseudanabaena sp. UWO310]
MRKIVIAGNWKMYKTQSEAKTFFSEFPAHLKNTAPQAAIADQQILICVPYTNLAILQTIVPAIGQANLSIGAQNVHWSENGAFTGEISAPMLVEIGIKYVIVGHSERRQFFGETEDTVNKRLKAAQSCGLTPILCVGESKQQRDANETESWIFSQLAADLVDIDQNNLIIAYEPIWAIGTGDTCASSEANRVIGLIRSKLVNRDVTIQYGGSVKPDNIDEIMAQPEIDGVLVGGASLDPAGFARIVNYR